MMRPQPPEEFVDFDDIDTIDRFESAPDLLAWIRATFLDEGSRLYNPDHQHLQQARLGTLWTNCDNSKQMRSVVAQAELMPPMAMGKWQRARAIQQVEDWFEGMPDFLLTFSAPAAAGMDDTSFCALVEHELYHCGVKLDEFGGPKFKQDGTPAFAMRGHDVEEFVGVVARYGADAAGVSAMIDAAQCAPLIGRAAIAGVCGTCLRAVSLTDN